MSVFTAYGWKHSVGFCIVVSWSLVYSGVYSTLPLKATTSSRAFAILKDEDELVEDSSFGNVIWVGFVDLVTESVFLVTESTVLVTESAALVTESRRVLVTESAVLVTESALLVTES